jgi:hypothetical protein
LIFPTAITDYCKTLWGNKRSNKYSFQGLVTDKRKVLLEQWISNKLLKKNYSFDEDNEGVLSKLRTKLFDKPMEGNTKKRKVKNLLLWESDRGRNFPIKSWDDYYFRVLADTEFVLCPSGDCSGQVQPDTFLKEFSYSMGD